jgi:hypothetical protein
MARIRTAPATTECLAQAQPITQPERKFITTLKRVQPIAPRPPPFRPSAEEATHSYSVALTTAGRTSVVINELMADNENTIADPQGDFDDWIELRNVTDQEVDLTGRYLTDDPTNPRKWQFPDGTTMSANGYLLVWADEDGSDTLGLHANFKFEKSARKCSSSTAMQI